MTRTRTRAEAAAYAAEWAESAHYALTRSKNAEMDRRAGLPIPADRAAEELAACQLNLMFAQTWAAIAAATPEG